MLTGLEPYETKITQDQGREATRKAAMQKSLVSGAKSPSESLILTELRSSPATSMADLERRTKLNSTAVLLSVRALQDRGLVRLDTNDFGVSRIIATR